MSDVLLRMEDVAVALPRGGRSVTVLDRLDVSVRAGEMVGLVGESGSGKTMAALSVMRLLPPGGIVTGRIVLEGRDLVPLSETAMRDVRGRQVGMVFQNPLAALNPSHTVGTQIAEAFRAHEDATPDAAAARALELLEEVGIRDPGARVKDYPHQFSGGMRQRVMIAMALACNPSLLIADEPTTGLDPLVARQIMELIARLRQTYRMGVLFITHDLSVIEEHADQVHVLYAGRSVEWGPSRAFFALPRHPYSGALLGSVPRLGQARLQDIPGSIPEPEAHPAACRFAPRCGFRQPVCDTAYPAPALGATDAACYFPRAEAPLVLTMPASPDRPPVGGPRLSAEHLTVRYAGAGKLFGPAALHTALHDIVLNLRAGECLGIVGESGSGKTTLGRALLQQIGYEGSVALDGRAFDNLRGSERRAQRRRIQVVFQDPRESLNPRLLIGEAIAEPLLLAGTARDVARAKVAALLRAVNLDPAMAARLPRTVSGGQAQRIAIARALAAEPDVIVLDEPTSALDVSTQAMLLNLLKALAVERQLSYVLISHDLACVSFLAHRIMVLKDGRAVEFGDTETLIAHPGHAYTQSLIAAAPHLHAIRNALVA